MKDFQLCIMRAVSGPLDRAERDAEIHEAT